MFARKPALSLRHKPLDAYPSFGGKPVRRSVAGHPATVALALAAAIAATALSLPSFAGPAANAVDAPAAPHGEVRTTGKADRLKPPAVFQGCDGVWGNEPLECLLQTA